MAAASASRGWATGAGLRCQFLLRHSSSLCIPANWQRDTEVKLLWNFWPPTWQPYSRSASLQPHSLLDRPSRQTIAWTPAFLCGRGEPGQSTLRTTLWSWPARRVVPSHSQHRSVRDRSRQMGQTLKIRSLRRGGLCAVVEGGHGRGRPEVVRGLGRRRPVHARMGSPQPHAPAAAHPRLAVIPSAAALGVCTARGGLLTRAGPC